MGAIAERVAERLEDQVALDFVHGAADQAATTPVLARGRADAALLPAKLDGVRADLVAGGQQDGAMHVFSSSRTLPRQPWLASRAMRGRGKRTVRQAVHLGVAARVVVGQGRDVAGALAQRRQAQADDVEAEVEVLAEAARR